MKELNKNIEDFEVAEDGRIIKINNWESEKIIHCPFYFDAKIKDCHKETTEQAINLGLVYATDKAEEKVRFKLEIETKLKNIAERLNDGWKIDWDKGGQCKYFIYYDFEDCGLCQNCDTREKYMGQIYCLNIYFLEVAKKEIGEENLIKYFKES